MKDKQYNIGKLDIIILTLLREYGKLYGLEIREKIIERQGRSVALATIYHTLKRLEKHELIKISQDVIKEEQQEGRPKNYFCIKDEGLMILDNYVEDMKKIGLFSPSMVIVSISYFLKKSLILLFPFHRLNKI